VVQIHADGPGRFEQPASGMSWCRRPGCVVPGGAARRLHVHRLLIVLLAPALLACSGDDREGTAEGTVAVTEAAVTEPVVTEPEVTEPELRSELLAMMEEDQAEQKGEVETDNYEARTQRLAEILDEYGWPTFELVGEDGSTAAWVIAQHADLDPELQQRALELLRPAAEDGQASRGDLAYLEDRVAVAAAEDQQYGTQMRCTEDGTPVPATPIADEATVDERRSAAGLSPLQDYVDEMTAICAGIG
jgi:uncharacterized protein DUF6624